ncbi:DNA repair protein RecO [Patulibacter sp.]|uniref:DNA repair protein RecO n=1 Tax=Patulibacter sp. TaxID=1912859 RepID=UPI00271DE98E|nr:DNA repair protein RecO [Patulibacter sp.]MDO9407658.1 DNA repair protein RecO [Patulibacter sp.]
MSGTRVSTEAVVLRSMRYGEADRILHAITPEHGRIGAVARGARRPKSKLGGRLEPLSVVRLELIRGRSDLHTVVGADTVVVHHRILTSHAALTHAQRACHVVDRTAAPDEPAERVHGLVRTLLALLDARPDEAHEGLQQAFRLKLLYALGVPPALGACVHCGRAEHLVGFDAAGGGVVCASHQAGAPGIAAESLSFMVDALGAPLSAAPRLGERPSRQVARAFEGIAMHHLGVDLRARDD